MISEKELDEISKDKYGFPSEVFKLGFRAAEKICLAKIAELKKDIIELIDLGADQVVTEKIVKLEAILVLMKKALETVSIYSRINHDKPRDYGEIVNPVLDMLKNEGEK